jgi:Flp pilus assembly protein TadG
MRETNLSIQHRSADVRRTPLLWLAATQRGQAIVYVAIALVPLILLVAIGIDTGHLALAANQVQLAADAGAAAGARRLLTALGAGQSVSDATTAANTDAQIVTQQNLPAGTLTLAGDCATQQPAIGQACLSVHPGHFNFNTAVFTENGTPLNALRAKVRQNVGNFMARIWSESSMLTKVAVAGLRGVSVGGPELPIMLGECYVQDIDCANPQSQVLAIPDGSTNTGWTNWNPDSSSIKLVDDVTNDNSGIANWLPSAWCANHNPMGGKSICGGGQSAPTVHVGDQYQFLEKEAKQSSWILGDGVVNHATDTFTVALIDCPANRPTKSMATVTGFATIKIDKSYIQNAGWDQKQWKITILCDVANPGPPGGTEAGTGMVVLLG